jgi:hypothetical protein
MKSDSLMQFANSEYQYAICLKEWICLIYINDNQS